MLRAATLTVTALIALTAALMASQPPRHVGPPLAAPVAQRTTTSGPADLEESLSVAYGLSSNSHGAPSSSAPNLATAPALRPELQSAYWLAVQSAPPSCHPEFSLLAAIGMVESGNLDGHGIDSNNQVVPALVGPALDGHGLPSVADTDAGQLDQDPVWDRAVGPMQLIPEVWRAAAVDMDGDGARDPQNVFDAAGAAMIYLCAENRDLSTARGVRRAVRSYNNVPGYLRLVLAWKGAYDRQEDTLQDLQAVSSTVAPLPMFSQARFAPGQGPRGKFSQVLSSPVVAPPSAAVLGPVTTAPDSSAITPAPPGADTGPLTATPPASATPRPGPPSGPPTPGHSDPTPAPAPEPPATAVPDPAPAPTPDPDPSPAPAPTPDPDPSPAPAPTPDPDPTLPAPSPTCVVPPAEATSVDPSAVATEVVVCPIELDPVPTP